MHEKEHNTNIEAFLSRRRVLKLIAGVPLVVTFGLLLSPFLRFLRPTLKPLDILGQSDQPMAATPICTFIDIDFPRPWSCIPFMYSQKYVEYNPEGYEIRKIPGFIMRTAKNEIVAFSRICTYCRHSQCVNFVDDTSELDYLPQSKTPVLVCPCDFSTYDPSDNGRVLCGPAYRPLRRMTVRFDGECYTVTGLESGGIA